MSILLETPRLVLIPSELSDLNNLCLLQADAEVMQYIGGVRNKDTVTMMLNKIIEYHQKYGFSFCSVFEKETNNFIGQAGLWHLEYNEAQPDIELGYRLHKEYWGKGYATELSKALINWGFDNLNINKLVAVVNPSNEKSCKVLEKTGFVYIDKSNYYNKEVLKFEIYKND